MVGVWESEFRVLCCQALTNTFLCIVIFISGVLMEDVVCALRNLFAASYLEFCLSQAVCVQGLKRKVVVRSSECGGSPGSWAIT